MRPMRAVLLSAVTALLLFAPAHSQIRDVKLETQRASHLIRDRRYEEAIAVLEPVCREHPDAHLATELLSSSYLKAGRPRDAVLFLEERLRMYPGRFTYIRDLGHAYLDLDNKEKAVAAWNLALEGGEKAAGYYGLIAKYEQEAGLYDEALETLRRGREYANQYGRLTMEIVRLERMLGNYESAFREGLTYLAITKEPSLGQARFLIDVFRETGCDTILVAAVDSIAAREDQHARFFDMLESVLLVEAGMYEEAAVYRDGHLGSEASEREFYDFLTHLSSMGHKKGDAGFEAYLSGSLELFLLRYAKSPIAPSVLLLMAAYERESALRAVPPDRSGLLAAVALADSAIKHPLGAVYREKAVLFKAELLLDDLHRPDEALADLNRTRWRTKETAVRAEELRTRALFASGGWEAAGKRFEALAENGDSTAAALGAWGLGMVSFMNGDYEEAVKALSAQAKEYAWSKWANDALATAILIKESMDMDREALDLYRSALVAREMRNFREGIDSLRALQELHSGSQLVPRAVYLEAELEEAAGDEGAAERSYLRLAESYPLHELAPRAIERLGMLAESARPEEAIERYATVMERYPGDPFIERVRGRYLALRRSVEIMDE